MSKDVVKRDEQELVDKALKISLFSDDAKKDLTIEVGKYFTGFCDKLVTDDVDYKDEEKDFVYVHFIGYVKSFDIDLDNLMHIKDVLEVVQCDLIQDRLERALRERGVENIEMYKTSEESETEYEKYSQSPILADLDKNAKRKERVLRRMHETKDQKARQMTKILTEGRVSELQHRRRLRLKEEQKEFIDGNTNGSS